MWKPNEVVTGQKRQAVALWIIMISIAVAYTSWLVDGAMKKRMHPTTWSQTSNTVYAYPDVWVCLYDGYGCDTMYLEEECMESSNTTEGGPSSAVFFPGGEYEQEIPAVGKLTDSNGWCLEIQTSQVTAFLGEERIANEYLDYFNIQVSWYPGGGAANSATCVRNGEEWKPHREWVYVFLNNPATGALSKAIETSYSCITSESNSHVFTKMGVGFHDERNIKEDYSVYKSLSTSSHVRKDEVNGNVTHPYAFLDVELQQEADSWEIVTEIDPLNVAEILGSIGGFWDLVLILWPIFFVVATSQGPHLKLRNFKKSGAEAIGSAGVTISVEGPRKNTTMCGDQSGRLTNPRGHQIEQQYWEATPPGTNHLV